MHVPTSFCRREIRPVVLGDDNTSDRTFMMSPRDCFVFGTEMSERVFMMSRESFVLSCKTVEHRSRKSRDLLQTDEYMVTHLVFVVTAFSVVACVLLHAHPSLRTAQGGIFLLDVVSENIPSGTVCVCLAWSSPLPRYCCCR